MRKIKHRPQKQKQCTDNIKTKLYSTKVRDRFSLKRQKELTKQFIESLDSYYECSLVYEYEEYLQYVGKEQQIILSNSKHIDPGLFSDISAIDSCYFVANLLNASTELQKLGITVECAYPSSRLRFIKDKNCIAKTFEYPYNWSQSLDIYKKLLDRLLDCSSLISYLEELEILKHFEHSKSVTLLITYVSYVINTHIKASNITETKDMIASAEQTIRGLFRNKDRLITAYIVDSPVFISLKSSIQVIECKYKGEIYVAYCIAGNALIFNSRTYEPASEDTVSKLLAKLSLTVA